MIIRHYLITRFNVQYLELVEKNVGLSPEVWLNERLYLFFKFCYPSVADQTEKNFKWIVYFDVDTPDSFIQKFRSLDGYNIVDLKFASTWLEFNSKVSKELPPKSENEIVITTRLDCDDAISKNAISSIQNESLGIISSTNFTSSFIVNFIDGLVYDVNSKLLLKASLSSNPFISLVNLDSDNDNSVYTYQHNTVKKYFKIIDIYNQEIWLQIIHGNNLLNKKIGKPILFKRRLINYFSIIKYELVLNNSIFVYFKELCAYFYFKYLHSRICNLFSKASIK